METRKRRSERISEQALKPKKKKKHRVLKVFGIIVLLLMIAIGTLGGKAYLDVKKASNQSYQTIERKTSAPLPSLNKQSPFSFLFLGVNGDTANDILVLTVNPKKNKTTVISLNRDIYLTSEGQTLKDLYASKGVSGEIDALQTLLNVNIPRYIKFDMRELGDFVEAVGGIKVQNSTHFIAQGYEFKSGTLSLKRSDEVKAFLTKVGDDAKIAEKELIDREQTVLISIIPKMKSINTVFNYQKFVTAVGKNIKTDFTFDNIQALGLNYHSVLGNIVKENLKPVETTIDGQTQKILSEELVNKAHDKIEEALNE